MNSDRVIKPLREYEVHTHIYQDGRDKYEMDKFTADDYTVNKNRDGDVTSVVFTSTGNILKEFFGSPVKIIVTPVE